MFDPLNELEMAVEKVAAFEGTVDVERIVKLAERVEFLKVSAIGHYDRSGEWKARRVPVGGGRAAVEVPDGAARR